MQKQKKNINFSVISIFQFIFSILVILLHADRIFPSNSLHFIQKSIFSRMAVPFFIVCSVFIFYSKIDTNKQTMSTLLKKHVRSYLFWFLIYLPYALIYFFTLKLPLNFLPLGFIFALLYTGSCYHLWYYPALITGITIVNFLKSHFNFRLVLVLSFLFYLIGATETYSAYLDNTKWLSIYMEYKDIFLTSRNGIFFTPVFICIGSIAYRYRDHSLLDYRPGFKLVISSILFAIEGYFIFINQGIDKNFYISLLPFSLFLFNFISRSSLLIDKNLFHLKSLSNYYFFLHPIFIETSFYFLKQTALPVWQKGTITAFVSILGTHILSSLIINSRTFQKSYNQNS